MENNQVSYLKINEDKIINEKCIKWVQKIEECLYICTKSDGCEGKNDTHKICKHLNPNSYKHINKHFIE